MILKNILTEIQGADKPVARMFRKGEHFHVLAIGFKERMVLEEHKSNLPARIVVIKGEVVYNNDHSATTLGLYDEYEIPVDELHWVEANRDSLMLVIKG